MGTLEGAWVGVGVVHQDQKDPEAGSSVEACRVTVVGGHHLGACLDRVTALKETSGDRRQVVDGPFQDRVAPSPEDLEDRVVLAGTAHLEGKVDQGDHAGSRRALVVRRVLVDHLVQSLETEAGHC